MGGATEGGGRISSPKGVSARRAKRRTEGERSSPAHRGLVDPLRGSFKWVSAKREGQRPWGCRVGARSAGGGRQAGGTGGAKPQEVARSC